jgi:ArsR family transcriptional regulator, virulence genes transcriptional regulator
MGQALEGFGGTQEQAARAVALLKSLSHEGRLQMLCLLLDQDMNVTQLADALGTTQANVSQQLMRLRAEGIVQTRRSGKQVFYQLARAEVAPVVTVLRDTFCRHPD